jgi:isocitrate dehydrogenase
LKDQPPTPTHFKPIKNPLIMSKELVQEVIVGVDLFVESEEQPDVVAQKMLKHCGNHFELIIISNRGTQVWPKGSIFTNLVNQYRCRFETQSPDGVSQEEILQLQERIIQDFKICSSELLNMWAGKKGYSLAQGQ